jgi:hypothetical protein
MGKNMETGDVERKRASVALLDADMYVALVTTEMPANG